MGLPFRVTDATLDVIEVLLSGDDELYGLKISKLADRPSGTVVPILMRLEGCGWVLSDWEHDAQTRGPRRRFYRVNPDHMRAARALIEERRGSSTVFRHVPGNRRPRLGGSW